ncbi:hypothetical protein KKI24_16925 [bacterium]|nr:hypothetical protein [bacterium]
MTQESKNCAPARTDDFPLIRVMLLFAIIAILELYMVSVMVPDDHIAVLQGPQVYSDYILAEAPAASDLIAVGKKK